jgi:hypothetical protein
MSKVAWKMRERERAMRWECVHDWRSTKQRTVQVCEARGRQLWIQNLLPHDKEFPEYLRLGLQSAWTVCGSAIDCTIKQAEKTACGVCWGPVCVCMCVCMHRCTCVCEEKKKNYGEEEEVCVWVCVMWECTHAHEHSVMGYRSKSTAPWRWIVLCCDNTNVTKWIEDNVREGVGRT